MVSDFHTQNRGRLSPRSGASLVLSAAAAAGHLRAAEALWPHLKPGASLHATWKSLAYKIDTLLDDPERFAAMQQRAKSLGRPRAA